MLKNKANYVTSSEAATLLGFSADHVRKLIRTGKIKAERIGRNWIIDKRNLEKIHRRRFVKPKENEDYGSQHE